MQLYVVWATILLSLLPFLWWLGMPSLTELKENFMPEPGKTISRPAGNFSRDFIARFSDAKGKFKEKSYPELYRALRELKRPGWKTEPLLYSPEDNDPEPCRSLLFFKPGKTGGIMLYLFPFRSVNAEAGTFAALQTLLAGSGVEFKNSLALVLYGDHDKCAASSTLSDKIEDTIGENVLSTLTVAPATQVSGFYTSATGGQFSSLLWREFFPELDHPSLATQIAQNTMSFTSRESRIASSAGLPNITYFYPQELSGSTLFDIILPAIGRIDSVKPAGLHNRAIWLTQNLSVGKGAFWFIILMLVIASWFPALNRITIDKGRLNLFSAAFSASYFTFSVLVLWLVLLILDQKMSNQAVWISAAVIFVVTIPVLRRIEKKMFMVENGSASALMLLNILLSIIAFINPFLFIVLLPFILFGGHLRQLPGVIAFLLALLCLAPAGSLLWVLVQNGHTNLLTPDPYLQAVALSPATSILYFFTAGSIIALLHKPNNRHRGL